MSKILKSVAGGFVNIISHKNNKEIKDKASKSFSILVTSFIGAQILKNTDYDKPSYYLDKLKNFEGVDGYANSINNWFMTSDLSPLQAISKGIELGLPLDSVSGVLYMVAIYSGYKTLNAKKETPIQDKISQYGSDMCPYNSYISSQNDLKAKNIQMKINFLHNLSNEFEEGSRLHKFTRGLALFVEKTMDYVSPKFKKLLSFIKKEDLGFELLSYRNEKYNNPKLINELPISRKLKEILRPETFDLHNTKKNHERKFVSEIRDRANYKSQYEIRERNIGLALAKLILNYKKNGELNSEEKEMYENIKNLSSNTSTSKQPMYVELSKVSKFIFEDIGVDNFIVKDFKEENSDKENIYHILKELDNVCNKVLKCKPLRKPMPYREIYRNELIFCTQEKLRGKMSDIALINRMEQISSPAIREHFLSKDENLEETLNKKNYKVLNGKIIIDPESVNVDLSYQERIDLANEHRDTSSSKPIIERMKNYDKIKDILESIKKSSKTYNQENTFISVLNIKYEKEMIFRDIDDKIILPKSFKKKF